MLAQQALQRREALFDRLQPGRRMAACLRPRRGVAAIRRSARVLGGPRLPLVERRPRYSPAGSDGLPRARRLDLAQPLAVVAQLAGEIPRLDRQRAGALGERVERGIDAREGIQARGGVRAASAIAPGASEPPS